MSICCGFLGLGLIGGSIAKAIKAAHPEAKLIAYDRDEKTLSSAKGEGIIDCTSQQIDETFRDCDYIFLCAPVEKNCENLKTLLPYLSKEQLLTDVGSVKTGIHETIESLGLSTQFIGGHPMAGSERFGYANSAAALLENAYYILTPSPDVPGEKISAYETLVKSMGAIPLILPYEQHDFVTAAISHLPHVIAASLVNLVRASDSPEGIMKMIAAGGFKDITRIASSSPEMWQQICLTNGENIDTLLSRYIDALEDFRKILNEKDAETLYRFFDEARVYRESFAESGGGPIMMEYVLTVDIADKPGSIAAIATLLAAHDVSIKNIGINHNRELAEGALRIEFYEKEARRQAGEILEEQGYQIHQRT